MTQRARPIEALNGVRMVAAGIYKPFSDAFFDEPWTDAARASDLACTVASIKERLSREGGLRAHAFDHDLSDDAYEYRGSPFPPRPTVFRRTVELAPHRALGVKAARVRERNFAAEDLAAQRRAEQHVLFGWYRANVVGSHCPLCAHKWASPQDIESRQAVFASRTEPLLACGACWEAREREKRHEAALEALKFEAWQCCYCGAIEGIDALIARSGSLIEGFVLFLKCGACQGLCARMAP